MVISNVEKTKTIHFHESIIIRILCFLPAESVIRCRSVCKNWFTLIFSQFFVESYSVSRTRPLEFLLPGTVGRVTEDHKQLFLAGLDHTSCNARDDCAVPVITKSVLPDSGSSSHIKICSTCSFTGFIVAYAYSSNGKQFVHPYHIFNPITSQHIVVRQYSNNIYWRRCALLLAHKSNQLKLLKVTYKFGGLCAVEIQTIGRDSWRTLDNSTFVRHVKHNFGFPCFLNGIYHWHCWNREIMVCFNPDEEVFHCISTPRFIEDYYSGYLGILDGCLCICTKTCVSDLEFWVMKEYGAPKSWIKKLVIPNDGKIRTLLDPLRFLKYGEDVVLCDDYNVIFYNLGAGTSKFVTYYVRSDPIFWYVPIPYVPNFRRLVYG